MPSGRGSKSWAGSRAGIRGRLSAGERRCGPLARRRGETCGTRARRHRGQQHGDVDGAQARDEVLAHRIVQVPDPVRGGFVASLAHPGGNITGIYEFRVCAGGKWLDLLREITPGLARVAVIQNPGDRASIRIFSRDQDCSPIRRAGRRLLMTRTMTPRLSASLMRSRSNRTAG